MIPYFDASSTAADLVPIDVLRRLHASLAAEGLAYVVVGAAARDLGVHAPAGTVVQRATKDVDIAVAVESGASHEALLARLGHPSSAAQRVLVHGVEVDVIPFGGGAPEVRLSAMALNVTGLLEAAQQPTLVRVAQDLEVPVAAIHAQAALKILAWVDRFPATHKDALDLGQILKASSHGVFEDSAWEDEEALDACEGDITMMGPYRLGRAARDLLPQHGVVQVMAPLDDATSPLPLLLDVPEGADMLGAFRRGLSRMG